MRNSISAIQRLWGATRPPPGDKQQRMAALAQVLTRGRGDAGRGKALFTATCATCHTLFGEGQKIGPDLTGYERDNLDFLLVSIVDPSAGIREEYTNYEIETKDGLLLSGYIIEQTPQSVTIEDGQEGRRFHAAASKDSRPRPLHGCPKACWTR